MSVDPRAPVLLTGATGFVGGRLFPVLRATGLRVRSAARDVARARERDPSREWVHLDVDDTATIGPALAGCGAAFYLVHHLATGKRYEQREVAAATAFGAAARAAGVARIVYLGGMAPRDGRSRHLASRARTGDALRASGVPVVELQAAMIVGAGSESWRITRDLAVRYPTLVLPTWARNRSQPVAIGDVVAALVAALSIDDDEVGTYAVPGPEALSAKEILVRTARLAGERITTREVRFLPASIVGRGLGLLTRADNAVARELAYGLLTDVLADDDGMWALLPGHRRTPFDEAARTALEEEARTVPLLGRALEAALKRARRAAGR